MQPDFGSELRFILFENITTEEDLENAIKDDIIGAITTWLPYLNVTRLDVNFNVAEDGRVYEPDHTITIFLELKIVGTNIYLPIQIFISDTGNLRIQEAQN
jgi:hypothetical protein